ncbi:MAG: DEAD/DEAH box helicase [Nocardioides sp.]
MNTDDAPRSPAEGYRAAAAARRHPRLHDFAGFYPFGLDEFQVRACQVLEDGGGVLVAAPTGSGKTIVGEFAIYLALTQGTKAFYTTPIKALSNQKYHDLVARYGADQVGLLTGDNSINGEAPIVVMTTEVLRNMLYAASATLAGLGYVVMDEVHYLADRSRGAVWEEVIIHLPESVALVSLSATVSNAEEFGEWLETVRGDTTTIVEERRPVPLFQHVMVGRGILPLFTREDRDASAGFVREGADVNPQLVRIARDEWASTRLMRDRRSPRGSAPRGQRPLGNGRRVWIPSRVEIVERLEREGLLPAIVFIFSRAGCDAAVKQCLDARLRLTTQEEAEEIRVVAEEVCRHLPDDDLHVLGYYEFVDALTRGLAAHHAGMLPAFKECVEELFVRGLVKVVFATETLALGINMPARTVVLEKLDKWNGETHADISPGEYTQLTGRAGRRGLDVEGHAVVVWQPGFDPGSVAGLASTRTYPLRSSFRPSYNMAVNLVDRYGRHRARELLECSFAQFQADRAVVGLARRLRKAEDALAGYAESAACDLGDFMEYAAIREQISSAEKGAARARKADHRNAIVESLGRLRRGDVIKVSGGKSAGWAVVVDPGLLDDPPRPYVVTGGRAARRLSIADFTEPVAPVDRLAVPKHFSGRNTQHRKDLAARVVAASRSRGGSHSAPAKRRGGRDAAAPDPRIDGLRAQLKAHPCHRCPQREEHARWAERWFRLRRDAHTLEQRVEGRTNTVARIFDRVCDVLVELGYLTRDPAEPEELRVTDTGKRLKVLYSELDLLVSECLRQEIWVGLTAPELGGALSALVFEARRPDDTTPAPRSAALRTALIATGRVWREVATVEKRHKLDFSREPDAGFAGAAYGWIAGEELDEVLTETGLPAGDFVRSMRLLIDLLGQVADAAPQPVRGVAREAVNAAKRGVVTYSSLSEE